jgi:putative ABC transport system permease protein
MTLRIYRALLALLLPSRFHDAFADDMTAVFAELARERGPRAVVAELPGLIRLAVRARRSDHTTRAHTVSTRLEENMLDSLIQDLRFALRALRRTPGFALVAVLTLALGIGANTAIFSVVNTVLLSPLRLGDPDRLVAVNEVPKRATTVSINSTSAGSFFDWQSQSKTMQLAAYSPVSRVLTGRGEPQQLIGTMSIGGLLQVTGVQPLFGRLLTLADEAPDASPVVVLSFDAWQRLFGDDRRILGQTLDLGGVPNTIVGVMPQAFGFQGASNDFWLPSHFDAPTRANRDQYFIIVIGRLAPGATIDQARTEMAVESARLTRDWPKYNQGSRIDVAPLRDTIVGNVGRQLWVLMGAVGFVLLITCANLGNLLLARATTRQREIAVRRALGAGGWRIARQMLTESTVLAALGGVAGLAVGKGFLKLLLAAQVTTNLPRAQEIVLDGRVLLFTLAASVLAGVIFGSAPAWQLARGSSGSALRDGTRGSSGSPWMRNVLVVAELALAMVLLTGAGLVLRSFSLLQGVNPGVRADHVLTFSLSPRKRDPSFFPATLERIRALPGVRSVAIVSVLPVSGRGVGAWFNRIDRPLPDNVQPTGEPYRVVSLDYFSTVGIALRSGRLLGDQDTRDTPAIVVNQALVKKYYPGENPLGKPVYLGAPDNRLFQSAPIVGVVADTRDIGLGSDPLPTVYIPNAVMPQWPFFSFVVRAAGNPTSLMPSIRAIVHELDATVPVRNVQTLDDVVSAAIAPTRWSTTLLGTFAALALVMAVLGVFGVLSFLVTQQTRELGIRIALGASSGSVRRLVVRRGLGLVAPGLAIGVAGALALTRFMTVLLFGVTPTDPLTFVGVSALLTVAALLASYLPARRATRVDPIVALRTE